MAGFNVMDMLNKTSKEGIEEKPKARFRTKDIDIYNIYANEDNISDQIGIDEKAAEIKLLGLLQPLEVMYEPNQSGEEYKLIGGERRWRALKKLVEEEDLQEFREATCQIRKPRSKNEEIIELCISNSYRKATPEKELERIKAVPSRIIRKLPVKRKQSLPVNPTLSNKARKKKRLQTGVAYGRS